MSQTELMIMPPHANDQEGATREEANPMDQTQQQAQVMAASSAEGASASASLPHPKPAPPASPLPVTIAPAAAASIIAVPPVSNLPPPSVEPIPSIFDLDLPSVPQPALRVERILFSRQTSVGETQYRLQWHGMQTATWGTLATLQTLGKEAMKVLEEFTEAQQQMQQLRQDDHELTSQKEERKDAELVNGQGEPPRSEDKQTEQDGTGRTNDAPISLPATAPAPSAASAPPVASNKARSHKKHGLTKAERAAGITRSKKRKRKSSGGAAATAGEANEQEGKPATPPASAKRKRRRSRIGELDQAMLADDEEEWEMQSSTSSSRRRSGSAAASAAVVPSPATRAAAAVSESVSGGVEPEGEDVYEVEKIVGDVWEGGVHWYRIKWLNYDEFANSWQRPEDLQGCLEELQTYGNRKEKKMKQIEKKRIEKNREERRKKMEEKNKATVETDASGAAKRSAGQRPKTGEPQVAAPTPTSVAPGTESRASASADALGSPASSSATGSAAATTTGVATAMPSPNLAVSSSQQEFIVESGVGGDGEGKVGRASAIFQVHAFSSLIEAQRHGEELEEAAEEDEQMSEVLDRREAEDERRKTAARPSPPPAAGRFSDDEVENDADLPMNAVNRSPEFEIGVAPVDDDIDAGAMSDSSTTSDSSTDSTSSLLIHPQHKHRNDIPQCILAHDWYEQENDQPTWLVLVKWKSKPVAECSWEPVNSYFFSPGRARRILTQYVSKLTTDKDLQRCILKNLPPPPPRKQRI